MQPKGIPSLKMELTLITPELAQEWIDKSPAMRSVSVKTALSYELDIKNGHWNPYPPIDLNEDGRVINGHHRLTAIARSGKSVWMYVVSNVPMKIQECFDVARPRALPDQIKAYRPGEVYPEMRGPYINMCAYLLTGSRVRIASVPYYKMWAKLFGEGIDWAVKFCAGDKLLKPAPIGGSLAFAYALNQKSVKSFAQRLHDIEGVFMKGDPSSILLTHMRKVHPGKRSGTYRLDIARGVLNAARAHHEGTLIHRVTVSDDGRKFYRDAYNDSTLAAKLAEPWMNAALV